MTIEQYKNAESILTILDNIKRKLNDFERMRKCSDGTLVLCTAKKFSGEHDNVPGIYFNDVNDGDFGFITQAVKDYFESKIAKLEEELASI